MKIETGAVAVITGAAGGIGSAVAEQLAQLGCDLALLDLNPSALDKLALKLQHHRVKITTHQGDITDIAVIQRLRDEIIAQHGHINILHNNAGITNHKRFENHQAKDWQAMFDINFWATVNMTQVLLNDLKNAAKNQGAHIVNMSSLAGFVGMPNTVSYAASKAAVRAFSEAIHCELSTYGIGVTSVHPGAINTGLLTGITENSDDLALAKKSFAAAKKIARPPEECAQRIVQAIQKNAVKIRIGYDSFFVDILKRLFPAGFVRFVAWATNRTNISK